MSDFVNRLDDYEQAVIATFIDKQDSNAAINHFREREAMVHYEAQLQSRIWELKQEIELLRKIVKGA